MNKLFLILQRSTNFIELVEAPERHEISISPYTDIGLAYYYDNLKDWTEDIDSIIDEVIKTTENYLTFDDIEKCKNFLKQNLGARFIFMTERTITKGIVEQVGLFTFGTKLM